ncbi:hypothetical protein C5B90_12730 [Haloferax sp. Atlit-12N]|uniref:hypothetical protein n=1 Tax=Haloferax sp. Atlit-12N TaxID=2077203 RepID=UPI000E279D45|nr:hypothetical protein [Haloferax sp. Atlit-12N]RDZ64329.1 hypothetical protein C5B90_12730 [Haloferax sp. Atlit-12N]
MTEHTSARRPSDALDRATAHVDRAEELLWECARDLPDDADDEFDRLFERLWAVQNELRRVSFSAADAADEEEQTMVPFDFPSTGN